MYHANDKYSCLIIKLATLVLGIVLFYIYIYIYIYEFYNFVILKVVFCGLCLAWTMRLHFTDYNTYYFFIIVK